MLKMEKTEFLNGILQALLVRIPNSCFHLSERDWSLKSWNPPNNQFLGFKQPTARVDDEECRLRK